MQLLVLGAGLQGAACDFDLLTHSQASVTLADIDPGRCPPFLTDHDGGRLRRVTLDIRDESAVSAVMREHVAAVSALPYYFNFPAARLALESGIHFADLGGNTEIVRQQEGLRNLAVEKGVTVVPDCGLAPGMINILARDAIERLDRVDAVRMYVGGLPQHPEPPLNYQIVYSLEGALDYYTTQSWILRDGEPTRVDALSEVTDVIFPEPVGRLEAFHTAGGLSTMPWEYKGAVSTLEYKTLRYPGHVTLMHAIRELGLLNKEPVDVKGTSVIPRDVFIATVDSKLRRPDSPDLVALKVVAEGERNGVPATRAHTLVDRFDPDHGVSAMMRTTGYSLAITCQMQVDGRIGPAGVQPAYRVTPAAAYIQELSARGVIIETRDT